MKHIQTFEGFAPAAIANVQMRGGSYIVFGITGGEITRKSAAGGEMLVGFSADMIVIQRGMNLYTYSPEFRQIDSHTLAAGDAVRAVVGPNMIIYRPSGNFVITYDKNFRELLRQTQY
jgi:hypothetical protein